MRGRLLLLILALFLAAADAASQQVPGSPPASGEAATPGATAGDSAQSTAATQFISLGTPLAPDGDNQKLREQILNALRAHSSLASSSFNVEVSDSQIELSGSVPTAREKETARRIAQSYGNNRSVVDAKIDVRNAGGAQGTQATQR
jgi:osmotically-inducible protein OsmY